MRNVVLFSVTFACGVLWADTISISADGELSGGAITEDTIYELAGHVVKLASPLVVSEGVTLTISDSVGTGILDYTARKGYAVVVKNGALVLNGGTIRSASGSGAVYLASSAFAPRFTMNGGKVLATSTGTEATAIFAGLAETDNAIVEVNGGEISGLVGIALAGRNRIALKDGVKIANTVVNSAEPTHWGVSFAGGNLISLAASGNILVGGEGSLGRDEQVGYVVGNGLKTGHYSSAPLALAIANGYAAKKTDAVDGYPWELVKDVRPLTVSVGEGEVEVEIPKKYLEENGLAGAELDEVREFLERKDEATGLTNWQRAQLGLDANGELAVSAIDGENQTTANVVLSRVKTIESSGKLEISYSLHANDKDGEVLATKSEPTFMVDLSKLSKENPVEKWVVTANFTATTNDAVAKLSVTQSVQSVNSVGAVRVDNPGKSVLLATPWVRVRDDGSSQPLAVKDMVDPVTLSPSDELNVYNEDGTYAVYQLDANKQWKGVPMTDASGVLVTPNPDAPVKPGQAVWLNRKGDTTAPVYLLGQVEAQSADSIRPAQGSSAEPVATILGNPHPEETVISAKATSTGDVQKDELLVVEGNVFRRYVRNDAGELGYYETDARGKLKFNKVDEVTVPAGEAFWYQSNGGTIDIPVGTNK